MSKNKKYNEKKVSYTKREEKQGKHVIIGIGVAAVILAVLMVFVMASLG